MALFGKSYDNGRIEVLAREPFKDNPVMERIFNNISLEAKKGVLKIEGTVDSEKVKNQVEEKIQEKLKKSRVDFKKVDNQLEVEE